MWSVMVARQVSMDEAKAVVDKIFKRRYQLMAGEDIPNKRLKQMPPSEQIKNSILNTSIPLVLKNILNWKVLDWKLEDWVEQLGNPVVDLRLGTKRCTKIPQWETDCDTLSMTLKEVFDNSKLDTSDKWVYFDYKHIKNHFSNKHNLFQSISWSDFGFPELTGKDSTIWIGTQGAHTPCHMDSYGCNIVAQVYGRKLWVLFPPNQAAVLKPTRVPYEESSVYSDINFSCGLNLNKDLGEARVVVLEPGDVLVVPRHWWHFVENLSTAISINMWIPQESDHTSRLEESLVRFFIASTLENMKAEEGTHLLNPNEMDLLNEKVDLRQISWCLDQVLKREVTESNNITDTAVTAVCVSEVPTMSTHQLQQLLLKKCGCVKPSDETNSVSPQVPLSIDHIISAFCHPDVISKVSQILISMKKS